MRLPRGRQLFWLYVLALAASHAARLLWPRPPQLSDVQYVSVPEQGAGAEATRPVRVVYEDEGPGADHLGAGLPVVLLHGSPGGQRDLGSVALALADERRTVRPALPGFGRSEHAVSDYSIAAHAGYVRELLGELGIERAHLVGFSMGGGVALELAEETPELVASIALISAIGAQELELFGDYHLNHAVHGLQLGLLWFLWEGVPHFGLLDDFPLSVEYARNFYDTDQRPLRGILERWEGPLLILHGRADPLVPLAAAEEHARIVPQSEVTFWEGGHFLVFRRGSDVAGRLGEFFSRVEGGRATRRASAPPERVVASTSPFDPARLPPFSGFSLVVFLLLAAAATLVSEDLTCVGVGALIGQGRVGFLPGVAACFLGIFVGDLLLFLAGRWLGRGALGMRPWSWFLTADRVERSSLWLERRGPAVIFLSRFMPGFRLPTYFASGLLQTSFLRFSFWFALAALIWTPILVWISSGLGGALSERVEVLEENLLLTLLVTVGFGFLILKVVRPLLSWRGRRLFYSSWLRLVTWEFWPAWVFYAPIVPYVFFQGLRRGRPLVFTAANPAILHGGFVGESKAEILSVLTGPGGRVPATRELPTSLSLEERIRLALGFLEESAGTTVVVKPDVGERGRDVTICRSARELEARVREDPSALIVQEFVPGEEFGLFYVRSPAEARGRLISVAAKRLPFVVGDGRADLERLILRDPRAIKMARFFLREHAGRLDEVPRAGERVVLGELGTHCKGALFLDAGELCTPALEAAVDEIAHRFEGFFFGRFDVRASSAEELAGGDFRILELNGVTSESAHVYDPRYSALYAWRVFFRQWGLAVRIGAENARAGARVSSFGELARAALALRRRAREARRESARDEVEMPSLPETADET